MKARIGKTVQELYIGVEAYFAKTMTETDMLMFAGITGDLNQLPTNEEFARKTSYGPRVAHGLLTASLATLECRGSNQRGETVLEGRCVVIPPVRLDAD